MQYYTHEWSQSLIIIYPYLGIKYLYLHFLIVYHNRQVEW